jgi:hypothetical protein
MVLRSRQSIVTVACVVVVTIWAITALREVHLTRAASGLTDSPSAPKVVGHIHGLRQLPLGFERNEGQAKSRVDFLARSASYLLSLDPRGISLDLQSRQDVHAVQMRLLGTDMNAEASAFGRLPGVVNYFVGDDPAQWRTRIPTFDRILYRDIYPGIDVAYHGDRGRLEFDFIVAPGSDPGAIRLEFVGLRAMRIDRLGNLVADLAGGRVLWRRPVLYQEIGGNKHLVAGSFVLKDGIVSFKVGDFDPSRHLIVDPVLAYSSYLGGTGVDEGRGIAVDSQGSVYVHGSTTSADFPTLGPNQGTLAGSADAFVTKLNATGDAILYSTYLGGSGEERPRSIAVDELGYAYLAGGTHSADFPTANAFDSVYGGNPDVYVTKLGILGDSLVFSTYLGHSAEEGRPNIDVVDGEAFVSGFTTSNNFPIVNPLQSERAGKHDAFLVRFSSDGSRLIYSTFLGGADIETARGLAVDPAGNAYVGGWTFSDDFPTQNAYQGTLAGDADVFVAKVNGAGSQLEYSTYLGGRLEDMPYWGEGLAIDAAGSAYITGHTFSPDFPTASPIQGTLAGNKDAFIAKLGPAGDELAYSTYLGGTGEDEGTSIGIDDTGGAFVTGWTYSANFPTVAPIQSAYGGNGDVFVAKLTPAGTAQLATYVGGSGQDIARGLAVDASDVVYVTGKTNSVNWPVESAFQGARGGTFDAFVLEIAADPTLTAVPPDPSGPDVTISFTHSDSGATFACSLDGQPYAPCTSPAGYSGLSNGSHTFRVVGTDSGGDSSPPAAYTWSVAPPDTTTPTVTMKKPGNDDLLKFVTVSASWSGTDDVGISRYDVYERMGTTGAQALVQSSTRVNYSRTGNPGATYCYQVFAFDAAGNQGAGVERCAAVPHDDRSASIFYAGAVGQVDVSGPFQGTLSVLDGSGESAELSCTCRRIGILARKDPASGKVQVWVDGVLKATVDLYRATTTDKVYVYMTTLALGPHTVQLTWTGTKNPSSSGSDISLDGIGVVG